MAKKNIEDFLSKHLKTVVASSWNGSKPVWTRLSGSSGFNKVNNTTNNRSTEVKGGVENKIASISSSTTSNSASSSGSRTNTHSKSGVAFKKLTYEEIARKGEKQLCFKCDKKFGPNH